MVLIGIYESTEINLTGMNIAVIVASYIVTTRIILIVNLYGAHATNPALCSSSQ